MISTRIAGEILDITPHRVKQILNESSDLEFERKDNGNKQIEIPSATMSKLLEIRNKEIEPKKIVIKSQKGGVGGTTTTINVAIRAAQKGAKVLVWDLDPESNATSFLMPEDFNYEKVYTSLEIFKQDVPLEECILQTRYDGVFLIPAKGIMRRADKIVIGSNPKHLLREKLNQISHLGFTTIFFDIPPTFSRLSESAYITSDICLLPTDASTFGVEGAILTREDIDESCKEWEIQEKPEVKIFLSRAHSMARTSVKDAWSFLVENFGPDMLPIKVPERADVVNNINNRSSIFEGRCANEVRNAIDEIVNIVAPIKDKKIIQ